MTGMADSKAADVLAAHNEWRRGGDGPRTEPLTLGLALDRAIARLREPAGVGGEVRAWETEDGRVISASQKSAALRDGGASASSVQPYARPLHAPQPPAEAQAVDIGAAQDDAIARVAAELDVETQAQGGGEVVAWKDSEGMLWASMDEVPGQYLPPVRAFAPLYAAPPSAPVGRQCTLCGGTCDANDRCGRCAPPSAPSAQGGGGLCLDTSGRPVYADAPVGVEELVETWRDKSQRLKGHPNCDEVVLAMADELARCADELERALAQQPAAAQEDGNE